MTFAPQEIQKTLYTVLSTDSALQTLLGGGASDKKVYDRVPQEQTFPFVTIGEIMNVDRGSHNTEGYSNTITIHVWDQGLNAGRKQVQTIQKRIDELLHNQEPSISGWDVVCFRRSSSNVLIDPDNITFHGVQIFNLLTGEHI